MSHSANHSSAYLCDRFAILPSMKAEGQIPELLDFTSYVSHTISSTKDLVARICEKVNCDQHCSGTGCRAKAYLATENMH